MNNPRASSNLPSCWHTNSMVSGECCCCCCCFQFASCALYLVHNAGLVCDGLWVILDALVNEHLARRQVILLVLDSSLQHNHALCMVWRWGFTCKHTVWGIGGGGVPPAVFTWWYSSLSTRMHALFDSAYRPALYKLWAR